MKTIRLMLFALALALLIPWGVPASAQGPDPSEFDYRAESLSVATSTPLVVRVGPRRAGVFVDGVGLTGVLRCLTEDDGCLESGRDGTPFTVTLSLDTQRPSEQPPSTYDLTFVGRARGTGTLDVEGAPTVGFNNLIVGTFTCQTPDCTALDVEMLSCGAMRPLTTGRMASFLITGEVAAAGGENWLQTPGEYALRWQSASGVAYFTRDETSNPVCTRMREMAQEHQAGTVDFEDSASADAIAASIVGEAQANVSGETEIDSSAVINEIAVQRDGETGQIRITGYWVRRCPVETETPNAYNAPDHVYEVQVQRAIAPDTVCAPGIQPFDNVLDVDLAPLASEAPVPLSVNGIIAVLIG
jgi:hypothetical protein